MPQQSHAEPQNSAHAPRFEGRTGAQILGHLLREHGVETVFACPGTTARPILEAVAAEGIAIIQTVHEQGAGHAADGYARATGRCGVCVVGGGSGVTNTITALGTAHMDSVPLLLIAGHVPLRHLVDGAFQDADAIGITRSCTKWNRLVCHVRELPRTFNEAMLIANSGRPGPVLIDLPIDVQSARCGREVGDRPDARIWAKYGAPPAAPESSITRAAEMLNAAQRPVIYAGRGALLAGAQDVLRELAEKASIPCTTTLLGLGVFDESHPLSLRMLGMHGSAAANFAVQECDCLLAVGARFDDRVTADPARFALHANIIHFDIDPANIGKIIQPDLACVGDARKLLELLLPQIEPRDRHEWLTRISGWKKRYRFRYFDDSPAAKPQYIVEEIEKQTKGDAVIVTGVGQHQMWTAQFVHWRRPGRLVTSGGLGTMGYGLPAAIGAAVGSPGRTVIDIDGDGSFQMTCVELPTIARYNIPLKVAIISNRYLGMVKQWQDLFYERRYSQSELCNPDFPAMAEACGIRGLRCARKEDVAATVQTMLAHDGPVVAEFQVERDEHVYPIVGPGKGLHEMHLGTADRLDF